MDAACENVLAYTAFSKEHWPRIGSTNPIDRRQKRRSTLLRYANGRDTALVSNRGFCKSAIARPTCRYRAVPTTCSTRKYETVLPISQHHIRPI